MPSVSGEKKDITIAKGLGILLVVIGHILARGQPAGHDWFVDLTNIIYLFHMPFFMALSGYVFFRLGRVEKLWDDYSGFVLKQSKRLLIPFVLMGLLVLFGKLIAANFLHVDNQPPSILDGLYGLVWNTEDSPATFIWYIFVLFVYAAIMPILFHFSNKPLLIAMIAAIFIYILPHPEIIYLDKIMPFFFFFILGGILRFYEDRYLAHIDRFGFLWLIVFIVSLSLYFVDVGAYYKYVKLIVGCVSIPALHTLCRLLTGKKNVLEGGLTYLGHQTLVIYLFNVICIGVTKGVMFKFISWDGVNFLFVAPVLILSGLLGPLIILYSWRFIRLRLIRVGLWKDAHRS